MEEIIPQKNPNVGWKVKVYLLNATGNWDDCGTGILEMVKENINGEEIDFFQVSVFDESSKLNPPPVSPDKLHKLKGVKDDERYIMYRPLMRFNSFEKQGGKFFVRVSKIT